nr:PLP-dependent aminotransferase family protein [Negativicutes bacterium]
AEGGMFFWATLPESIDTMEMLDDALAAKVAYVPGVAFYPDGQGKSSMRLNFSNATPEKINEGITKLGEVIASRLK